MSRLITHSWETLWKKVEPVGSTSAILPATQLSLYTISVHAHIVSISNPRFVAFWPSLYVLDYLTWLFLPPYVPFWVGLGWVGLGWGVVGWGGGWGWWWGGEWWGLGWGGGGWWWGGEWWGWGRCVHVCSVIMRSINCCVMCLPLDSGTVVSSAPLW